MASKAGNESVGTAPVAPPGDVRAVEADAQAQRTARIGVIYGLAAYLWWGFVAIYFKAVKEVPPLELLTHRVVWSIVLLTLLLRLYGRLPDALRVLRERKVLLTLCITAGLLACNWFTFIWAIINNQLRDASLGYFINPLINVLLGYIFLKERLRPWQKLSVFLALAAVAFKTVALGQAPVVALVLAFSFGTYGLIRKTAKVGGLVGLTVEVLILLPIALVYGTYLTMTHQGHFGTVSTSLTLLLILGGAITAVPLIWFTNAAQRLRLATLGFLQYLAPSLQLLLAVALYNEPFGRVDAISFAVIWTALAIYSVDTWRASRVTATSLSSRPSSISA